MSLNCFKVKYKIFLLELLQKYEELFDSNLGKETGSNYIIELKEDAKPFYTKPLPIPNTHKLTLKKEINGSIKIG